MSRRRTTRRTTPTWVSIAVIILALLYWAYTNREGGGSQAPAPAPTAVGEAPTVAPAGPTSPSEPSAPASGNRNLRLGNPSGAAADPGQPTNFLIERPQYALSYNRDRGTPNWVSWQLTAKDLGDTGRSNEFTADTKLPKGWYRVTTDDYSGSGYDRGHMCPSADRTSSPKDNQATFILTNVLPQAPGNNRVTWEHLESLSRELVGRGHTLYIIAGGDGKIGTIAGGKITVPAYTWKIIVVMPKGQSDISRITADTTVLAVRIPNGRDEQLGDWDQYRVTVASIEEATGYRFFTSLAPDVQAALKSRIDPAPRD